MGAFSCPQERAAPLDGRAPRCPPHGARGRKARRRRKRAAEGQRQRAGPCIFLRRHLSEPGRYAIIKQPRHSPALFLPGVWPFPQRRSRQVIFCRTITKGYWQGPVGGDRSPGARDENAPCCFPTGKRGGAANLWLGRFPGERRTGTTAHSRAVYYTRAEVIWWLSQSSLNRF